MRPGTRFVSHHLEQGPGCDFVPPLEAVHRIDSLLGLRGSHHGQFAGRPDGTNVIGGAAEPPADGIRHHRAQQPERRNHRAAFPPGKAVERDLRHHGGDPGVVGGHRDDVAAAQGRAELHRLRAVFLAAIGADGTQIEASLREAICTAKEQKSISLEKRAESTFAEYRRQKASGLEGRGFRLALC